MSSCKFSKNGTCKLDKEYLCCDDPDDCELYQGYLFDTLKDEEDRTETDDDD